MNMSNIQKGIAGAAATFIVAIMGWSFSSTENAARQDEQIEALEANVKLLNSQYSLINSNLMDLIHKQDKRLTVLEYILLRDEDGYSAEDYKREVKNGN